MVELALNNLAQKMDGSILQGSPDQSFDKYNIDSRLTQPGELFFAIEAGRDGHKFIEDAYKKGAAGAVVSKNISISDKNFALIQVPDTLQALQQTGKKVLSEMEVKVVGITGSIGKTTTKEFTSSLLSLSYKVFKSRGNYNNYLGLPLSILQIQEHHEIAVLEMGINQPHEMKTLTHIAPPDLAAIINILPVHLEFFQTIEELASTKKEILEGMKKGGTAVLNGDNLWTQKIAHQWKGPKLLFGLSKNCPMRAVHIHKSFSQGISCDLIYEHKQKRVHLPFIYDHYLYNFLSAAAIAQLFSVPLEDIPRKTPYLKPGSMRGTIIHLPHEITLVDDSYNSNPVALKSILKSLASFPSKRKVAVLGDMLELGEKKREYHVQAGSQLVQYGWDILITVGPLSKDTAKGSLNAGMERNRIFCFDDSEEAAEEIPSLLKKNDLVLIKGSRGIKTEKIVEKLKQEKT
ncbi:UDP-N-acetylmuramoyl-tripeptide--D-alanyl-D-alanine ligase [bacterium]|nr:UDP-N-acetylmuramoyl-tripeptide--D-alanyl-D-alanine ligase [bacterium]